MWQGCSPIQTCLTDSTLDRRSETNGKNKTMEGLKDGQLQQIEFKINKSGGKMAGMAGMTGMTTGMTALCPRNMFCSHHDNHVGERKTSNNNNLE